MDLWNHEEQLDLARVDLRLATMTPLWIFNAWSYIGKMDMVTRIGCCKTYLNMSFNISFQIAAMEPNIVVSLFNKF